MWGISQYAIRSGLIHEEWTICNEFQMLQQMLRDGPKPLAGGDQSALAARSGEVSEDG